MFRNKKDQKEIAGVLNYQFKDEKLLLRALTRQSALNEGRQLSGVGNFQRLEFLGDKVLNLVVSDVLAEQHATWDEGRLTQETARYVNNKGPLADVARRLMLGNFLVMGLGEEKNNNARDNEKVLSDAMEALLGALWLDTQRDYQALKSFIVKHWGPLGLALADEKQLFELAYDYERPVTQRLSAITNYFNSNYISEDMASNFLSMVIADETAIVKIALTKKLPQPSLNSALAESIEYRAVDKVTLLLRHRADPNTVHQCHDEYVSGGELCYGDSYMRSVLQLAILDSTDVGVKMAELLLQFGADVNWQGGIIKRRTNPSYPREMSLNEILQYKRDSKIEDYPTLDTALHLVVSSNSSFKFKMSRMALLFKYKANPNLQDHQGDTPLHILINNYELYLDEQGVIIDAIETLLKAKADLNKQNKNGDAVLHVVLSRLSKSIRMGRGLYFDPLELFMYTEIIELLQNNGANMQLANKKGVIPQQLFDAIVIPKTAIEPLIKAGILNQSDAKAQQPKSAVPHSKNSAAFLAPPPATKKPPAQCAAAMTAASLPKSPSI